METELPTAESMDLTVEQKLAVVESVILNASASNWLAVQRETELDQTEVTASQSVTIAVAAYFKARTQGPGVRLQMFMDRPFPENLAEFGISMDELKDADPKE